ncbi:HEAT repeat domain-containing protein [Gemmata sp. G18]|uniref:HEAT repeat domain-containing protein n=1 Tax=Gemmata palustris TaxID=2822762 RepID=A0ABS5BJM1_9BACT|nr:HEAT repeat domain-containing protein [Gemmata palustris]MBP3953902.1 HEAT repeat domain-containing protein [Gemmata palustris]
MRRLFAAIGTCGLAVGVAGGNPPAPVSPAPGANVSTGAPAVPSRVAQLIARLGAEDFRDRESAVAELEKSGPGAIPLLRDATKSDDPEVRRRAAGILFRLERNVDSAALLVPKKIALAYRDTPLGSAINDLKARTKLNLALDTTRIADPLRKVTCVTAGEVPVWEALEQFCAAAGLREAHRLELDVPKQQPQGRRVYVPPPAPPAPDAVPVVLIDGSGERLPGARDSAVRVLVMPRKFPGHRVTLGTGDTTLCFDVAPIPGLNWQDVVGVKIHKLVDDAGRTGGAGTARPFAQGNGEFEGVVAWGGGMGFVGGGFGRFDPRTGMPIPPETLPNPRMVSVPLKLGTPNARTLKRLEGYVLGEIQVPNQNLITITNPAKNTGTAFDGAGQTRLTVMAVGEPKGNAGVTVQLRLEYPSPWAVNARRGFNPGGIWPESPRATQTPTVQAYDASGKQMLTQRSTGDYNDSSDDGTMMFQHITMTFRKDAGAPAKVVLVGPRPVIVEVPFVMENVQLP